MSAFATPLVSVILPFYNEVDFLHETIDSVLQQEYTNWEIILIDDAGSDACTQIAKAYAENWPDKIFYNDHPNHANKGLSASRNVAIAKAKGELLAFLDADDKWLPAKLKEQVQVFQQHPEVSMICEASSYWYSWEDKNAQDNIIPIGATPDKLYAPPSLSLQLYPLGEGAAPCPSAIMVKKEASVRYHNFEDSFTGYLQGYEDQVFLGKFYLNEVVYVSGACNNLYRQRNDSLMHRMIADGKYINARLHFLEWLKQYMAVTNIHYTEVDKQLAVAIRQCQQPNPSFPNRVISKLKKVLRQLQS